MSELVKKISDPYEDLEPIEKLTVKSLIDRLNYSQLEVLLRIANEKALPTDQALAKGFASEIFSKNETMQPFIKGFLQNRGRQLLEQKTRQF